MSCGTGGNGSHAAEQGDEADEAFGGADYQGRQRQFEGGSRDCVQLLFLSAR